MILQLQRKKELMAYIQNYAFRIEKALIYSLEYLVADLQNHAKLSAGYQDQTSNLKSSIGGVVLKDGKPISYKGFTGTKEGTSTGMEFLSELIAKYNKGYVIVLVAGMEYGVYVENRHGLNVLAKSEMKMNRDLPLMLAKLKSKIQ